MQCRILPGCERVKIGATERAKVQAAQAIPQQVDARSYFDRVIVISLQRRKDRLQAFKDRLIDWPFAWPRLFSAIDARWRTLNGNAAAACMLSHMAVVSQALADGVERLLILEDDAEPVEGFGRKATEFIGAVPSDWECLMFGGQLFDESQDVDCGSGVRAVSHCERLHCYALNRSGMASLLDYWSRTFGHCDHRIAEWQDAGHRTYAPTEFLVAQSAGVSDITHDIQPRRMFDSTDPPPVFLSRPDNTAVITIGCYPVDKSRHMMRWLHESADLLNVPLHVFGSGEFYNSHYSAKVLRLQRWIDELPDRFTHVLFLDGGDTFLNGGMNDVCAALNYAGDRVIMGMEKPCNPEPAMAKHWPDRGDRSYLNSGVWGGRRDLVQAMLRAMVKAEKNGGKWRDNDQFLAHAIYAEGFPIMADEGGRLAANLYGLSADVPPNSQFTLENDGRLTWRDNGISPCVVHFNGMTGPSSPIGRWWAKLRTTL